MQENWFPDIPGTELSAETVFIRLFAAGLLAMVIGWERERRNKPAGLRTHMLVGIGAATYFLIFTEFALGPLKDNEGLSPDPTRVIEGVITGIGFLGAGAIIQGRGDVKGLTTGAGIWVAGAIGLACGAGYYLIASIVTAMTFIVLTLLGWLSARHFDDKDPAET
jgi:putative Mg2+ transporter-C (MgtC) family protein